MNSLMQLSRALNDARVEKEAAIAQAVAQTKAEKLEAAADERQEQLIKVDKKSYLLTLSNHRSRTANAYCEGHSFVQIPMLWKREDLHKKWSCLCTTGIHSTLAWLFTPELRPLSFGQVCITMMKCIVKLKPATT